MKTIRKDVSHKTSIKSFGYLKNIPQWPAGCLGNDKI